MTLFLTGIDLSSSRSLSTISYNTEDYLTAKLDELVITRKIEFYAFIEHLPEDDETKKHKHLLIIPNGTINTDQVQDYLTELDPTKPDGKPLGCIMFRSSTVSVCIISQHTFVCTFVCYVLLYRYKTLPHKVLKGYTVFGGLPYLRKAVIWRIVYCVREFAQIVAVRYLEIGLRVMVFPRLSALGEMRPLTSKTPNTRQHR